MRDSLRHFIAEFIGTFAIVFIGGASIMAVAQANTSSALLQVALAHGFALAVFVSAFMRISGHFNPAVTIGFIAARRIDPMMAGVYIVGQLLGAVAAAYVLKMTVPPEVFAATRGGGQTIAFAVSGTQAWMLEAVATFFLVFIVFGTAVDPHAPRLGGFAIGATYAAGILAIGSFTGGSMNPARTFGPAFAAGMYDGQFIYWTSTIVGGTVAALLYDTLFIRRSREPVSHGAVEP